MALSGLITGLSAMVNRREDESALGSFVGGFIDGAIGAVAISAGLAVGAAGGALGNATGQLISYGDVDGNAVGIQALYSGMTAGFSTGILKMTGLFPKTGDFMTDFINNLSLWSAEDSIYNGGPRIISAVITAFLAYLSLPNANNARDY